MRHITNKEWKRIVEQTSRTDLPEPPFSQRYRERRLELARMVTMKEDRKFTFQPGLALATAAALAIAAVPAGMIWKMSRDQMTPPETPDIVETGISPAAAVEVPVTEPLTDPIDNSIKTYEFGWLPEGMYLHEDGPYAGKIHSDPEYDDLRGITPEFIRLPENMTFDLFTEQVMLSEEQFRMEGAKIQNGTDADNKNPDFWIFHNGHGWDEVWKQFSDTPYVMHLYYQGVTEEEIRQVLQNIRLVPAEEETAGTWVPPEDRGPEELEFHFLADFSEATLQEANQWDTPWRGKVVQDAELADYSLENVCQGLAEKGDQSYSALQIRYDKTVDSDYLFFDLIYTNAPVEELPWNETDEDIQIMDYDTFRVCVFTGDCTDEERSGILAAIETAASRETPDEAPIPEPTKDVPWFWLGYGVNSHGETYASAGQIHMERKVYDQLPDLIAFGGDTFKTGYVRKTELFEVLGDDPDDAMNHLMQDFNKTDTAVEAASLNVYDKEGEQVLHVIKYYKEP